MAPTELNISAVLQAAGLASRMGFRPKCLIVVDGTPLIVKKIQSLQTAGINDICVVLGHYAKNIEPIIQHFNINIVHNPNPDQGQISSQRLGLQNISNHSDAVIMALADQPLIQEQDISHIIIEYQNRSMGIEWVYPIIDGQPGNPVIFSTTVAKSILSNNDSYGCSDWRNQNSEAVHGFLSANQNYVLDIDTPDDLIKISQQTGHLFSWPMQ
ncbi:MAG: nucleotidyltransferase family protein [Limnohabitans sp.]|nr:nucleotidyltransferase family protein [Limnohabitans sp.]